MSNITKHITKRHSFVSLPSSILPCLCSTTHRRIHPLLRHRIVNPKPTRDRNARVGSFDMIQTFEDCLDLSKFDQEILLSLDLAQFSILNIELLKIHIISRLVSEVATVTSKAEAFPKASPAALQVDVPTASAASTIPGPAVGEESKKTDL
jgi:hypothetical protein